MGMAVSQKATHIALLRAVNLGGLKPVAMADLRKLGAKLGFADVGSVLQSGNLVFRSPWKSCERIERMLEEGAERNIGLKTEFFVRNAEEWHDLIRNNPFRREAEHEPALLVAMLLKDEADASDVKKLQAAIVGRELVRAKGRVAYITFPDGQGRSKLTRAIIEKALGTRTTGRNWNTVLRLGAMVGL